MATPHYFKELFLEEDELLAKDSESGDDRSELRKRIDAETPGPAGEPWIRYTPFDRVGLAFSGGGIRSATFNLGVLKALHELGVLKYVDYLSTVSGGGYIGAWWTAWRARIGARKGKKFPEALLDPDTDKDIEPEEKNREPEEVRHLREFSDFLSPRIGFFESEMWNAVMAVLSAVLPAVLVGTSLIVLAFVAWLGVTSLTLPEPAQFCLALPPWLSAWWIAPLVVCLIIILVHVKFERSWRRSQKADETPRTPKWIYLVAIIALLGGTFGWYWLAHYSWMKNPPGSCVFFLGPHLFEVPLLWTAFALVMLVPRLLITRRAEVSVSGTLISAIDRALSRMLGAALVFALLAALWLTGCWMLHSSAAYSRWSMTGGAFASGGAFALLRNWIGNLGPAKKGGIMDAIKPLIPQILAYVAVAFGAICIAVLLARWIENAYWPWCAVAIATGIAAGIIVFAIFFFDPAQVSLHSFYRNRLTRAYLGASNPSNIGEGSLAEKNRQTDVRKRDDIELRALSPTVKELTADQEKPETDRVYIQNDSTKDDSAKSDSSKSSRVRPLHLICCAANDLGGDQLGNLSRGARSAVLSKFGFAIGDHWKEWEKNRETLGLGSAITASAAAFNSNMGSLSMTLGAGVTFLCSALNLRLGLWLGHPLSEKIGAPKWTPGRLFLMEMFGLTNSGLRPPPPENPRKPLAKYVHLSDGGHFENLALYELVRRHCRYIIVSDCGADPEVAFDDFGNAVRRIREDFGVEIDIDLSPLKPNPADRLSKQHVAVGTISYDPRGDQKDTGILLYFKPTLTGDEPCDITQYRTRNKDFPHETTGDQFYDEAQWESYRRLGEHATRSALRFVEHRDASRLPDAVFNDARWEWYQSPERLKEKFVELTGRFTALEAELREKAPEKFVREMFPELQTINARSRSDKPMSSKDMSSALHFLVQIIQLMEDVWLSCDLDTHFNDPNNLGWVNTFQRWAYTPAFRLWWPLLKSMYGSKFRRFMEERLDLADEDYPETIGEAASDQIDPEGLAMIYWTRMHGSVPNAGRTVYAYKLHLPLQLARGGTGHIYTIQAGLAFLDLQTAGLARWNSDKFFVPPGLWGAGIGGKFLDALLGKLPKTITTCEVTLGTEHVGTSPKPSRTDIASRQERNDLIAFYKRAGFQLEKNQKDQLVLVWKRPKSSAESSPPSSG